jgi:hypothetical protein
VPPPEELTGVNAANVESLPFESIGPPPPTVTDIGPVSNVTSSKILTPPAPAPPEVLGG